MPFLRWNVSKSLRVRTIFGSQEVVKNLALTSNSQAVAMYPHYLYDTLCVTQCPPPPHALQKMVLPDVLHSRFVHRHRNLTSINEASKASLYWCQWHQRNTTYAFEFSEIFKYKIDSTVSMTMRKIPNLSDSESFWYWILMILNLSGTNSIWYQTYQIPNLSVSEPVCFRSYLILNSHDTEPTRY